MKNKRKGPKVNVTIEKNAAGASARGLSETANSHGNTDDEHERSRSGFSTNVKPKESFLPPINTKKVGYSNSNGTASKKNAINRVAALAPNKRSILKNSSTFDDKAASA